MNVFFFLLLVHCSNSLFRFFCNVCFLRKEIKCILILKKKVDPIQSVLPDGWTSHPSLIYSCPFILSSLLLPPSPICLMVTVRIHCFLELFVFPH